MSITNELEDNLRFGWIKFFRSIRHHWIYPKNRKFTNYEAWITILLEVNFKDEKVRIGNNIFDCARGEKMYSLDTWARLFGWPKSKVRRFFKLLEKDSMIVLKSNHITTHLIVCNYEHYQGIGNADETQMKNVRNANETELKSSKEDNNNNKKNRYMSESEFENKKEIVGSLKTSRDSQSGSV